MKHNISAIFAGAIIAATSVACSDSYLDLVPESDFTSATVLADTRMIDGAVNGLSQIMSEQYASSGFGRQGYNGEGTIILWFGSYRGQDAQYSNNTSQMTLVNSNFHTNSNSEYVTYPWYYYYLLIGNANIILLNLDQASGPEQDKMFYRAQTLTYRAYAYSQLVQFYSKRWSDSHGGSSRGVPLRLDDSTGDMACSSLGAVYAQVYADLDEALSLFARSGKTRGEKLWRTDASVAHAVYARAALAREDWAVAAEHARQAREGYKLMSAEDYEAGFNTPNSEWIWETYTDITENLGVYGFFAYCGSNTPSSKGYKYIGTISRDLIDQIPADDSRRFLYAVPQEGESGWSTTDSGAAKKGDFYSRIKRDYEGYIYSSTVIFPYMSFKFRTITDRSVGCVPIIRAAEMIYSEAEALCHLSGQESRVRQLLQEAVAPYQPGYTCDLAGDALLQEVKLYRRFDLWGEGRGWFDQKRWGDANVRRSWNEGGNWHPSFAGQGTTGGNYSAQEKNGWTLCIPARETNYNALINNNIEPANWTEGSTDTDK